MRMKICNMKIYITFLFLRATLINGFPQNKNDIHLNKAIHTINKNEVTVDNRMKLSSLMNFKNEKMVKGQGSVKNSRQKTNHSQDFIMHHENSDDGILKCLCWAELLIVTQNNNNKELTVSKEYAIILESPGDIVEYKKANEQVDTYTLFDPETKERKTLNFTIVKTTKEFTIKEHKTVYCGSGPILVKTYIEWPKLNKEKIEIRLIPSTCVNWQINTENNLLDTTTLSPTFPTFDTTNTESFTTTSEDVTVSISRTEIDQETSNSSGSLEPKRESDILSSYLVSKNITGKAVQSWQSKNIGEESRVKYSNIDLKTILDFLSNSDLGMKRELLMRNIYFKKLRGAENMLNITEPKFFVKPEYNDLYLFDLFHPNESTSSWGFKRSHKFLVTVQISIEHIIVESINGTELETSESVMVFEEETIYRIKKNNTHKTN